MTKNRLVLLMAAGWLGYQIGDLRRRQKLLFEMVVALKDMNEATMQYIDIDIQEGFDDEFVEIVEENFRDGL